MKGRGRAETLSDEGRGRTETLSNAGEGELKPLSRRERAGVKSKPGTWVTE
jgi:hypothetical protein